MTAEKQKFTMYQGNTKRLRFTVRDEAGEPLELAGSDITWVLTKAGQKKALLVKSSESEEEIRLDWPNNGICTVYIETEDTVGLAGRFDHELELTDEEGRLCTLARGTVEIKIKKVHEIVEPNPEP